MEQEMVQTLQDLVRYPSVKDSSAEGAPFGSDIQKCLARTLNICENLGYTVKNVDGYAGHAEYGRGENLIGILSHLDVVPVGSDWTVDPFSAVIKEGKIYGRGSLDNKGPTIAVIYALKAVIETGISFDDSRVRLIFGCDEESGWECVRHYFKNEETPNYGFTPDGMFPLINREKGILVLKLKKAFSKNNNVKDSFFCVTDISGGSRANMVPDSCEATIKWSYDLDEQSMEMLENPQVPNINVKMTNNNTAKISAKGISTHACNPELGENAVLTLLSFLNRLPLSDNEISRYLKDIYYYFDDNNTGSKIGIDFYDQESGPLTQNLGVFKLTEEIAEIEMDIRYPVSIEKDEVSSIVKDVLTKIGIEIYEQNHKKALYIPENHFLVSELKKAYENVTGEKGEPIAIGGGTYARAVNNTVAFGGLFPERPNVGHTTDEYLYIEDLLKMAEIYAYAIYNLVKVKKGEH